MTLEFSLRRRAMQSRCLAALWLIVAISILAVAFFSIPHISNKVFLSVSTFQHASGGSPISPLDGYSFYCAIGIIIMGLFAILYACFLLGRNAFFELELAARSNGLADALCISNGKVETFEKAAAILIPKGRFLDGPELFSRKDRESLIEIMKLLRNG